VAEAAGHGGIEAHLAVGFGVDEGEVAGVEGEAVGRFVGVAVHGVAEDGVAVGFELDADLVLAAGVELAAEVGDFLLGVGLHHEVAEDGEFALADVFGDVHFAGVGVFEEEIFELGFVFFGDAVDDDIVAAGDGVLEELFLEGAEGIPGAGEDEEAGGVAVEAVDEVDLVFAVLLLEVVGEEFGDEGAFFLGVGGGEEAVGFVDDEDVGVEVDDLQAVGEGGFLGAFGTDVGNFDLVFLGDGLFEGVGDFAVETDALVGEHFAQGGFLGFGIEADEFVEYGGSNGHASSIQVYEVLVASVSRSSMICLAGPNGAGKSTAAPALLRDALRVAAFLNADTIASGLSAFDPERVAITAGKVLLQQFEALTTAGDDFAFETTLASRSLAPKIRALAGKYEFHLIYLWLPNADTAVERVASRVLAGGHRILEVTIRRRYFAGIRNFFSFIDRLRICGKCMIIREIRWC
jgi:predicted ABC-type ATPase